MAPRKKWVPLISVTKQPSAPSQHASTYAPPIPVSDTAGNTMQRLNRFVKDLHALSYFGDTQAPILDHYRRRDGSTAKYSDDPIPYIDVLDGNGHKRWMQVKKKRVAKWTRILQQNDYMHQKPATCRPACAALAPYLKFPKLFGERKYAHNYPSSRSATMKTGFMDLPAELRNRIYEPHLILDEPIELLPKASQCYRNSGWQIGEMRWHRLAKAQKKFCTFLRLNKIIHIEASGIFYGNNEFRFTGYFGWIFLRGFMGTIGTLNTSFLRKITVHIHWPGTSSDQSDRYATIRDLQESIDKSPEFKMKSSTGVIKQFRNTPTSIRECISAFEAAGNLAELNLVLPFAYDVADITDLKLDTSKFKEPPKIKLVHLRRIKNLQNDWGGRFDEPSESQMPLQKFKLQQNAKRERKSQEVVASWKNPKTYAKARGWEYEFVRYGQTGAYPEESWDANDPGDELESEEDE